jgi:hypothetical protein
MTTRESLLSLEQRLAGASGPSRVLDFEIHIAVVEDTKWPARDWRMSDYLATYRDVIDRDDQDFDFPRYTSSIDSALELVERVLGDKWNVARVAFNQNDDRTWHAELREGFHTSYSSVVIAGGYSKFNSGLPNASLAICLALIRAMLAKEGEG